MTMTGTNFSTQEKLTAAFEDNYGSDPGTQIYYDEHRKQFVISWNLHDQFKRGRGKTRVEAIADFYDEELPTV